MSGHTGPHFDGPVHVSQEGKRDGGFTSVTFTSVT